jgi:hypothetical protein
MRRLLAGNNLKSVADAVFGRRREVPAHSTTGELPLMLEMPDGSEGKTVPTGIVMMALLWQHYGLDLPHPEVSRWLEKNAPDVKYAVALNSDKNRSTGLKVGSDGTIRVYLSSEVEQRLREVSSAYVRSHVLENFERQFEFQEEASQVSNSPALSDEASPILT